MNALEVSGLNACGDDGTAILRDVSLVVGSGEFAVVTGRNGSGKSRLLACIKGLFPITGGILRINGTDMSRSASRRNRSVALVFQDAESQVVGQSVRKDILFGLENLRLAPDWREKKLHEVVHALKLESLLDRRPHTLSGGEKRRLAIAGVLAMDPALLMLDEPFANLDDEGIVQVLATLVDLKRRGHTLVVVTHELEKVLAHADRLIVMEAGTVCACGPIQQVLPSVESHGVRRPRTRAGFLAVEDMSWLA